MTPGGESGWFGFGFRWTGGAEGGPEPLSAEGLGPVRRVRPSWSFAAVVAAGGPGRVRLQGAVAAALPEDCLDALPSETHVLLLREAALEAWPAATESDSLLDGRPAWRKELRAEEAAAIELPLVPGGYVAPRPPFFTALPAALPARRLLLGLEHALLLAAGGALFSWGGGRHGQLGHGDLESRREPRAVEALQGLAVAEAAAGGWHSAAVSDAGDLYLWGWNESGQLGLPSKKASEAAATAAEEAGSDPRNRPLCERSVAPGSDRLEAGVSDGPGGDEAPFVSLQAFPALLDLPEEAEVRRVSCGSRHTAAVTGPGHLYTWGWGKYGQLGHQDAATSDWPRRVCYFVERNLRVQDVVCGPWNTFVQAAAAKSGP
ncbi:RCC1 domain-containing protein 1 isoform X2 [Thamnophis elegans]|uniref:RCC1 domain-containing protein 1 isoform X2 n=1 Tax=Thamnophis elegans TaxID=35005 RepID=UPI001377A1C1|nr:RCC1 domain-containing protein 1 isoform X2 [Thamnophis elegans]